VHPDVASFYGSFWSDSIPVRAEEGAATLIQVWNGRDFERLIENLIGHALQKARRREPLTLFIACTDEGDFNLSVDNSSGVVVLEQPGQPPQREVARCLADLLARLEPAPDEPGTDA
jgi:SecY interacting protein Syd